MCWSQAQSRLAGGDIPPWDSKRSKGSFSNIFASNLLVPHRVGHDDVELLQTAVIQKLRVRHRVAANDLAGHVVQDHVHAGDCEAGAR